MKQAKSNISHFPSRIERLWTKYETAAAAKAAVYASFNAAHERTASGDPADDAACDEAEAACDIAYDTLEDIGDKILRARTLCASDLVIKARVLGSRDRGGDYDFDDVERFREDVQIVAGSLAAQAHITAA